MSVIIRTPRSIQPQDSPLIDQRFARGAVFWNGAYPEIISANGIARIGTKVNPIYTVGQEGKAVYFTNGADPTTGINLDNVTLPVTDAFTILVVAHPTSEATKRIAFSQKILGFFQTQVSLGFNVGDTLTTEADSVTLYTRNTSAYSSNARATSQIDGNAHCWVVSNSTTGGAMYRDGVPQTLATNTPMTEGTFYESTSTTAVGNLYNADFTTRFPYPLFLVVAWPRFLPLAEQQFLSANPWQVFAPIKRTFGRSAAAAGFTFKSRYFYDHIGRPS